ncbi:LysE/ArgO family amino acid transporter [Flexibacterium corallicola]|uniref:LysE/ArgO family amino acid transporter n=1 Tax=Flexibacterium corallicola TaxID=3037259 RepID=UPI00286F4DFF|nr:LysE/ArgO family amino acid transporter [Pseudovibrio sp. M1P-2-3]
MSTDAYITGFGVGFGLILAIGAQNAFVLRQGVRGQHIGLVALTCAFSDALLITAGVAGFEVLISQYSWLEMYFSYIGAAFLYAYGARSFYASIASQTALNPAVAAGVGWAPTFTMCLALTWLNPHVYLDTVFLIGAVSLRFPDAEVAFAAGAISASLLFFLSLGYGAAMLRPLLATAVAWKVLEFCVGIVMWAIATKLLLSTLSMG